MTLTLFNNEYFIKALYSCLAFLIFSLISRLLKRAINSNVQDLKRRHRLRKITFYFSFTLFFVFLFGIWTTALPSVTTILSFVGAGLALALHEVVLCIAGWVVIVFKKIYAVGERIEINQVKGDVIDIGLMHTVMLEVGNWVDAEQSTGRLVTVANSNVFRSQVYNYTKEFEFIWNEIKFIITFESNVDKAREIILSLAGENSEETKSQMLSSIQNMSEHYMVQYKKLTPNIYTKIVDNGVLLTLRYLTKPHKRRDSEDKLTRAVLSNFAKEKDIDFAYPTTRFYKM